jgi:hypothetical protein
MSEFIVFELKLVRTLLQLAVTDMADPRDPGGEARVIDHAGSATGDGENISSEGEFARMGFRVLPERTLVP